MHAHKRRGCCQRIGQLGLIAALAFGFLACESESDHVPFALKFEFSSKSGGPRVCENSCNLYDFTCRGRLGVRIVDADNPDIEHAFRCVDAPDDDWEPTRTLCDLDKVEIRFRAVPVGMARFEVALWREDQLGPGRACLRGPLFDLQGEPLITVVPQPVVAGATYFDIGKSGQVHVPMACIAPSVIAECTPPEF